MGPKREASEDMSGPHQHQGRGVLSKPKGRTPGAIKRMERPRSVPPVKAQEMSSPIWIPSRNGCLSDSAAIIIASLEKNLRAVKDLTIECGVFTADLECSPALGSLSFGGETR